MKAAQRPTVNPHGIKTVEQKTFPIIGFNPCRWKTKSEWKTCPIPYFQPQRNMIEWNIPNFLVNPERNAGSITVEWESHSSLTLT